MRSLVLTVNTPGGSCGGLSTAAARRHRHPNATSAPVDVPGQCQAKVALPRVARPRRAGLRIAGAALSSTAGSVPEGAAAVR